MRRPPPLCWEKFPNNSVFFSDAFPNHQHPPHHSLLPLPQVLSNYAIDEIYIRETPSWMFKEEKVLNQKFPICLAFWHALFLDLAYLITKIPFRQERCLRGFARIWTISRRRSLQETRDSKFHTPYFFPQRYLLVLLSDGAPKTSKNDT